LRGRPRESNDATISVHCLQDEDNVATFSLDADNGRLTRQAEVAVAGGTSVLAISPDRRNGSHHADAASVHRQRRARLRRAETAPLMLDHEPLAGRSSFVIAETS
jgi:hypothetical protein